MSGGLSALAGHTPFAYPESTATHATCVIGQVPGVIGTQCYPVAPDEAEAPRHVILGDMREYRPESRVQAVRILIEQGELPEDRFEEVSVEGRDGNLRFPYSAREWDLVGDAMNGRLTETLESLEP